MQTPHTGNSHVTPARAQWRWQEDPHIPRPPTPVVYSAAVCAAHAHHGCVPCALQVRLFTGIMFSDQPVQDEERIFGGRYKDITVECDPPQKVVLDGEVS